MRVNQEEPPNPPSNQPQGQPPGDSSFHTPTPHSTHPAQSGAHARTRSPAGRHSARSSTVARIEQRSPGFGRLFGAFTTSLAALIVVFCLGSVFGLMMIGMFAASFIGPGLESYVEWEVIRSGNRDTIVVLPVEGVIDETRADFVQRSVRQILDDESVQAVVLRVDSPGGAITPSDQIWRNVQQLQESGLPVVASYGSVAASGGYYVSCGADHIMAEETCITGSIGVIAQVLTLENLMDKVGVEPVTLVATRSPEKSTANDTFRSWTEEDRAQVRMLIDEAYDLFRQRVEDGRSGAVRIDGGFDDVADGSVFSARQALDAGLIDSMGYLDDAIAEVETLAGLSTGEATVVRYMELPSLMGALGLASAERRTSAGLLDAERLRTFVNELSSVRLMYLMH
jgi:protease-4